MLRVSALIGVFSMTALVMADPPPAAPATSDLDRVQGYWKPLQCTFEGKPQMPENLMQQVTVVFDKNDFVLYFKDSKTDAAGKPIILRLAVARVALNETTNPKTIHFEFADGPLKGKKSHGIYDLAGNQLKMCYGPADKPIPTKFDSPPGSGYFNETWKRQ
jgi:uncharacterized protein (TIGR03067 family)